MAPAQAATPAPASAIPRNRRINLVGFMFACELISIVEVVGMCSELYEGGLISARVKIAFGDTDLHGVRSALA